MRQLNGRDVDSALVFRADGAIPVFTLRVRRAFSGNTDPLRTGREITFRTAAKLATALKMDFFPDLRPQEPQEVTNKLPTMV